MNDFQVFLLSWFSTLPDFFLSLYFMFAMGRPLAKLMPTSNFQYLLRQKLCPIPSVCPNYSNLQFSVNVTLKYSIAVCSYVSQHKSNFLVYHYKPIKPSLHYFSLVCSHHLLFHLCITIQTQAEYNLCLVPKLKPPLINKCSKSLNMHPI